MRKLLAIALLTMSASAMAHQHGYWRPGSAGSWHWVAPVVVGGVIGYEIARPPQPIVVQQPVVVQPQPYVVPGQNCSPWTQVRNPDGSITTTRTCQ
jgi:hypothetical protein